MTKTSSTQSQKRFQESLAALFNVHGTNPQCLFLKSSSDIGVIRNGGRNGARFAPQSFLSTFKKFSQHEAMKCQSFADIEVGNTDEEESDFHSAQVKEAERIKEAVSAHKDARIVQIGGGHDHVYPLLRAVSGKFKKVIVINIDAHADTRTDENFHSGTPFRQFANEYQGEFHIFQIGLHPFANSFSTLSPLSKGHFEAIWKKDLNKENLDRTFDQINRLVDQETLVLFSLDADALSGTEVPGVSAVNPAGLTRTELLDLWKRYQKLPLAHAGVMGIYELNPVYDTLASLSMRTIGSFVFESLME